MGFDRAKKAKAQKKYMRELRRNSEEQRLRDRAHSKDWYGKNKKKAKKSTHKYAEDNWGRYAMRGVKRRSKAKGAAWDIDADWLNERLKPMVCEATGLKLIWNGPDRDNPWAPSVDRINSSKGYEKDNTQVTCWAYNWMKGKWPIEVMNTVVRALYKKEH